jgi:hypothetical protein
MAHSKTYRPRVHERMLSEWYDSVIQRRFWASIVREMGPDPSPLVQSRAREELACMARGWLRLDTLRYQRLVLTDAQLLDGPVFLQLAGLDRLLDGLKHCDLGDPPVVVRARQQDLEAALVEMVSPPGAEKLKGLSISSLPEASRKEVQDELARQPAGRVRSASDLVGLLKGIGVGSADLDPLQDGWGRLIAAARPERRLVAVERWPGSARTWDFSWSYAAERSPSPAQVAGRLTTEDGVDFARFVAAAGSRRSEIDRESERRKRRAPSFEVYRDLVTCEAWFHGVYNKALAYQHASHHERIALPGTHPISQGAVVAEELVNGHAESRGCFLDLPDAFVERLGRMPPADYQRAVSDPVAQKGLTAWWSLGSLSGLEQGLQVVFAASEPTPEPRKGIPYYLLSGAGLGLLGASGTLLDYALGDLVTSASVALLGAGGVKVVAPALLEKTGNLAKDALASVAEDFYDESLGKAWKWRAGVNSRKAIRRIIELEEKG